MLCQNGLLKEPMLYLSLYFKTHRNSYYDHLQSVRETGAGESWLKFFLDGVIETSKQATLTAKEVLSLFERDLHKIEAAGKSTVGILTIHKYLRSNPISNTTKIKEACNVSLPAVLRTLSTLEELEIVNEITGRERHKVFVYKQYLEILNSGIEPVKL